MRTVYIYDPGIARRARSYVDIDELCARVECLLAVRGHDVRVRWCPKRGRSPWWTLPYDLLLALDDVLPRVGFAR